MRRRTFVYSPLVLTLRQAFGGLWSTASGPTGENEQSARSDSGGRDPIVLANRNHELQFDPLTAQLQSLRASAAADQEFIPPRDDHPVFVIQYLDKNKSFRQILSSEATSVSIGQVEKGGAERTNSEYSQQGFIVWLGWI
jgi:hypothetical protein